MNSFSPQYLAHLQIPMGTSWLLAECMEAKGREAFWAHQKAETLKTLKEIALIQSAESSNRIEGVEVESSRLRPLILENAKPKTRPEEEILGYRKSLDLIHKHQNALSIDIRTIKKLHSICQAGAGDAGNWKTKNNDIIEFDSHGRRSIRFIPTPATETPAQMSELCLAYKNESLKGTAHPLLLSSLFILDFLCIHPFRDGNGRMSRLLTLLLLCHQNIQVGRFVSLERFIEENKTEYYEALKKSSAAWHQGQHNAIPWINFYLSTLRYAYKELQNKVESVTSTHKQKTSIVQQAILDQVGPFTLKNIQNLCPNASSQLIKKTLSSLKKEKKVTLVGRGRGAYWKVV